MRILRYACFSETVSRGGRRAAADTAKHTYFVVPVAPPCSPRETNRAQPSTRTFLGKQLSPVWKESMLPICSWLIITGKQNWYNACPS